jgi:tetratricopeptide (TPR) repeat protein
VLDTRMRLEASGTASAEMTAAEAVLDGGETWLYDAGATAGVEALEAAMEKLMRELAVASPSFHEAEETRKREYAEAVIAADKEAAERAAAPTESKRDKDERPLTKSERIAAAGKKKHQGNLLFKEGDVDGAALRYATALRFCDELEGGVMADQEQKDLNADVKLPCLLNLAQCWLMTGANRRCIENCDRALRIQEDNHKALFRRAKAFINEGELENAKRDLEAALIADPENTAVRKEIQVVNKRLQSNKAREKNTYGKMFSAK